MATLSVSSLWSFRDTEEVLVSAELREGRLVVQVEENLTAEQWRGQFDKKHIEELTRKTGNFKSFSVFLKMLESAITKSSDSVSLDLLTYSDLEALRNSKTPSSQKLGSDSSSSSMATSHTKRYLILTYSTTFDRIHYPLALPYNGQQDPAVLKNIIRSLSKELEQQKKLVHNHVKHSSIAELQEQYDTLLQEKEYLQEAYDSLQQDLSAMESESHSTRELRMLKKLTQTLEEDLLRATSKHQRIVAKKNQEIKRLAEELDETRAAQRMLNSRVKTLTNELAMNRREVPIAKRRRPSPIGFGRDQRKSSGKKTYQPSPSERSGGRGRRGVVYCNIPSARSPSPGGRARFDPSAYVESRRKRQQEITSKIRNQQTPPTSGHRSRSVSVERRTGLPPRPSVPHSRSSSVDSKSSSRRSSVDSADSRGSIRNMLRNSQSKGRKPGSRNSLKGSHSEGYVRTSRNQMVASTPKTSGSTVKLSESNLLDRSVEIDDIDARLLALQRFMKRSLSNARTRNTGEH